MKKNTPLAFVIIALIYCNACRNSTSSNEQRTKPNEEKVDTPDCSLLTTMLAKGTNSWIFSLKDEFKINNESKPILKVDLLKKTPYDDGIESLILDLSIDSDICCNLNSKITFSYGENTYSTFANSRGNNCTGSFLILISPQASEQPGKLEEDSNLKKVRENKIHSISLETHTGTKEYVLTDAQATELHYLINCIHKAK